MNDVISYAKDDNKAKWDFIVDLTLDGYIYDQSPARVVRVGELKGNDFYADIMRTNYDDVMDYERDCLLIPQLPEMPIEFIQVLVPIKFCSDDINNNEFKLTLNNGVKGSDTKFLLCRDHLPEYLPAELFAYDKEGDISHLNIQIFGIWLNTDRTNPNIYEFDMLKESDQHQARLDYEAALLSDEPMPMYLQHEISRVELRMDITLQNMYYSYGPFENALRRKCDYAYEDYHEQFNIKTVSYK